MTITVHRKPRRLSRLALAGLPRDASGRPLTFALAARIAWVVAYLSGLTALVLVMRWGHTPVAGTLALAAAAAGIVGMAIDQFRRWGWLS